MPTPAAPVVPAPTPQSPSPAPQPVPSPKPQPSPPPAPPVPAPAPINCVQGCGDRRGSLNGQTGVAIVRVEISQSGAVVAANIVSSSGNSALDNKAIAAARQMKFSAHNAANNQSRQVRINLGS
ncbi:hypothetical protein NIES208_15115 [[Limnothrix rosea] IAM M-220]|nr:hypothetical protein NIES208_15115 [[Limnothrix rosea] IAM M-220]